MFESQYLQIKFKTLRKIYYGSGQLILSNALYTTVVQIG